MPQYIQGTATVVSSSCKDRRWRRPPERVKHLLCSRLNGQGILILLMMMMVMVMVNMVMMMMVMVMVMVILMI